MKGALFFCSVLAFAASKPGGYYHQEYNYKTSSSSFKNNELQHKNEDQGFYSKDGDLEGRVKPKVNSHSQHSEYLNPKLQAGSSNYLGSGGYSTGSSGNYLAGSDRLFGSNLNGFESSGRGVDGYASSDRVLDLSNVFPSRGSGSSQSTYGTSMGSYGGYDSTQGSYGNLHGGSYGSSLGGSSSLGYSQAGSSNLGYSQGGSSYGYVQGGSSYGTSGSYASNANLNSLAQRLQDELSRQLESAIHNQYRSSGYTTSVSSSQMSADTRALEDELKRNLTRQLEESLRSQYGQQVLRGTDSYTIVEGRPSSVVNYNNQELAELTRRLEDNLVKKLHQNIRTTYNRETVNSYTSSNDVFQPTYTSSSTYRPYQDRPVLIVPSNIRYTPIPNPESITQIASRIQSNVNTYLDTALHNIYTKYIQSGQHSYYTLTDFDNEVNRIKDEIIRNLTLNMDDQIRNNYGQQVLKGDYYYSVSSTGQTSSQYNYHMNDLNNLRKQVEENLLRKLNQTVNTYREQYQRQQSYSTSTNSYSVTYRPAYYTSGSQVYDYSDLQRQLSQQLQNALNRRSYSTYSTSSSYNPQAYQASLDELTRELQRNLTDQLSNYRAQTSSSSSYGYSSSGGSADFESMKNQLQNQLMQQLQQGLQKQHRYSASASYSASSSSSSNSHYGGRQSYGNYENFVECCSPITDLSSYRRNKRDAPYGHFDSTERSHSYSSHSSSRRRYSSRSEFSSQEPLRSGKRFPSHAKLFRPDESYDHITPSKHFSRMNFQSSHSSRRERHSERNIQQALEDVEDPLHDDQQLMGQSEDDLQQQLEFDQNLLDNNKLKLTNQETMGQKLEDDMTQQLELSGTSRHSQQVSHKLELSKPVVPHQSKVADQELENGITQKLESEQQTSGHADDQQLTGQMEDDYTQQLELTNKPKSQKNLLTEDQQLVEQQLQDDLTQKLEVDAKLTEFHHSTEKHLEDQNDLTQQLELEVPKPKYAYTLEQKQKSEKYPLHRVQLHNEQNPTILDQELIGQQLEEQDENISKTHRSKNQYEQELEGQLLENDDGQKLELSNSQIPEQSQQESIGQQVQDQEQLTQQLEVDNSRTPKPKYTQQLEGQQLEDDTDQELELSNSPKPKVSLDQQEQDDLTQKLEPVDENKPTVHPDQELELEGPQKIFPSAQYVESSSTQKPKSQDQQLVQELERDNDLTQQLEMDERPKKKKYSQEPQEIDDDLTQQLESKDSRKPKLSDQKPTTNQQLEDQDDQQLELSEGPKPKKKYNELNASQGQLKDDLDQQLITNSVPKQKYNQDQELENKSDDDQTDQLEFTHTAKPENKKPKDNLRKPEDQQQVEDLDQQIVLNTEKPASLDQQRIPDQQTSDQQSLDQQIQEQDLTLQSELNNAPKPKNHKQISDQKQEGQEQVEDDLTQKLEISDLHKPKQTQEILDNQLTQQLEEQETQEPDQKLELVDTNKPKSKRDKDIQDQQLEGQQLEDDLTQQLELADLEKPKKSKDEGQIQQELDNNLDQQLELSDVREGTNKKPAHSNKKSEVSQLNPTYDLEASNRDENQQRGFGYFGSKHHKFNHEQFTGQTENNMHVPFTPNSWPSLPELNLGHKVITQTQISQTRQHPTQTFAGFGVPEVPSHSFYGQSESEHRSFTNGHSGHPEVRESGLATSNSYEEALRKQDALLNLLKQQVQAQVENQMAQGQKTTKRTIFVNGKQVSSSENMQFVTPNGGIVEGTPGSPFGTNAFSSHVLNRETGHFGQAPAKVISGPSSYSGNIRRTVYHVDGSSLPSTGYGQWSPYTGTGFASSNYGIHGNRLVGKPSTDTFPSGNFGHNVNGVQSTFTGKQTKRIIHFVNGKAVSASEDVQEMKPNGQVVASHHNLPLDQNLLTQGAFSHGFSSNQFANNVDNIPEIPPTNNGFETSAFSGNIKKSSAHYVNGRLVSSSESSRVITPESNVSPFDAESTFDHQAGYHSGYNSGHVKTHFGSSSESSKVINSDTKVSPFTGPSKFVHHHSQYNTGHVKTHSMQVGY